VIAVLRVFGFATLVVSGELIASPIYTQLIPGCPQPPVSFFSWGIGAGLLGLALFWLADWLGRSHE
jgi:hypothetical protein